MVPHNYYYPRTLARLHINLRNVGPSGQERNTPSRNLHGLEGEIRISIFLYFFFKVLKLTIHQLYFFIVIISFRHTDNYHLGLVNYFLREGSPSFESTMDVHL